ncbi:hypothetical protein ACOSP7_010411 [Xanthoceras sorbifolium]
MKQESNTPLLILFFSILCSISSIHLLPLLCTVLRDSALTHTAHKRFFYFCKLSRSQHLCVFSFCWHMSWLQQQSSQLPFYMPSNCMSILYVVVTWYCPCSCI